VFRFVEDLSEEKAKRLYEQLKKIDPVRVNKLYVDSTRTKEVTEGKLEPVKTVQVLANAKTTDVEGWGRTGMRAIADGKVAVIIMAGGQGTRLGFDRPKGEYNIKLPSDKCIFQLQAERILKLERLALNSSDGKKSPRIMLYLMTSPMTHEPTVQNWKEKNYYGMKKENVFFFQQGTLPCLTKDGKIMLESSSKVAMAPDGNGGIYLALHKSGAIEDMKSKGIQCIYTGAIDNAVSKVGDPVFIGYCLSKNADVGNKVCTKCGPHEKVGIQVLRDGVPAVVEYSDLDPKIAELRNSDGSLVFSAGNVCMHYYSFDFLAETCHPSKLPSEYHVAKKKIPYVSFFFSHIIDYITNSLTFAHTHNRYADKDGNTVPKSEIKENTGIKLESFIFDIFSKSKHLVVFEVERADEFSPVKNAPGSKSDSPDTARAIISSLHKSWLQNAGVSFTSPAAHSSEEPLCEISPLVSYAGEGLEKMKDQSFPLPVLVQLADEPVDSTKYKRFFATSNICAYSTKANNQGCDVSGCAML